MAYTQKEKQVENPVATLFKEIKTIKRLHHDANKPLNNKIVQNEGLKASEIKKRESFTTQALEKTTALKKRCKVKQLKNGF